MADKWDMITIGSWDAPDCDGAPLLTMPNVPAPMFGRAPRTIEPTKWNITRKKCYMDANYKCQACGNALGLTVIHAHELYSYDYVNKRLTFERCVALDPDLHTIFIHSGRALTLFEHGDKQVTKKKLLETAERGFAMIDKWNREHVDEPPLRVSNTFLSWAENPKLAKEMEALFKKYNVRFYRVPDKTFSDKYWREWRMVYKGKEYPPLYDSLEDFLKRGRGDKEKISKKGD